MTSVVADQWKALEYEVKMFYATNEELFTRLSFYRLPHILRNSIEESAVLHARILCDLLIDRKTEPDDVKLKDILPGWPNDQRYADINEMCKKLQAKYGRREDKNSPCFHFNKRLAHLTSHRSREFDYRRIINSLYPLINNVLCELQSLLRRHFRREFDGPTRRPAFFGRNVGPKRRHRQFPAIAAGQT